MSKRIITAACFAVLAAGCGTTQGGTTSTGSTGTTSHPTSSGSTSGNTTSPTTSTGSSGSTSQTNTTGSGGTTSQTTAGGSSGGGSTGTVCATVTDLSTLRGNSIPQFTQLCLPNVTTVVASSYGNATDGGTQFKGNYYVADSNGNVVNVFKNKTNGPFTFDPSPGDMVNVFGKLEIFPHDGGQVEVTGFPTSTLNITSVGPGTLPSPDTITDIADLTDANSNEIGRYVLVPAGTYTEDTTVAPFHFVASGTCANGCQDGVGLTSGSNTILVETFTYKYSGDTSCYPPDGGMPDLTAGDFKGVTDIIKGNDDALHKVVFLANCGK